TGAAILKACASAFGPIPEMTVRAVGYGAGTRDLEGLPNVMRLVVGETPATPGGPGSGRELDRATLLQTNIDDMNPQFFSHIYDDLFAAGALDVWVESVLMKKSRPGFVISVLAETARVPGLVDVMFRETTTSGLRLQDIARVKLPRRVIEVATRFGKIKVKVFTLEGGERCAPEYEDCLRSARSHGVTVSEVMEETQHVFRQMHGSGQ
ncbi:MAG TPA: LarC family nickel insertion protein, partial [bacterium]|nr:LarC family nickel insertion protein [bacterium]